MTKKKIISSFILIFIAVLWGGSFVAQSKGGDITGPFTFGFLRFLIAGIAILPVIKISDISDKSENVNKQDKRVLLKGGIICGFFLAGTAVFQQLGLFLGTPSGKAGFLTSCYIIFVPLIGLLIFKIKCEFNVWIAVGAAIIGLYLLCIKNGFSMQTSDLLVIVCSIMNASRIHAVDRFMNRVSTVKLACVQFFTASIILAVLTLIFEIDHSYGGVVKWWATVNQQAVWGALLYAGVLAGAVAFTLQIVAQKDVNPTVSALLMSLESVFSVLAGWLILGDRLSARELIGCAVIFVALVIAQIPAGDIIKKRKYNL